MINRRDEKAATTVRPMAPMSIVPAEPKLPLTPTAAPPSPLDVPPVVQPEMPMATELKPVTAAELEDADVVQWIGGYSITKDSDGVRILHADKKPDGSETAKKGSILRLVDGQGRGIVVITVPFSSHQQDSILGASAEATPGPETVAALAEEKREQPDVTV